MWSTLFKGLYQYNGELTDVLDDSLVKKNDTVVLHQYPSKINVRQVYVNSNIKFKLPKHHNLKQILHDDGLFANKNIDEIPHLKECISKVKCFHYQVDSFISEYENVDPYRSGTLIYIPPGKYTGGTLSIMDGSTPVKFESSMKGVLLYAANFLKHSVSPVESGLRVSYTSKVYYN